MKNYNKDNTIIIALCGKSSTGKNTLANWLARELKRQEYDAHLVVSDTTRGKRIGEVDKIDYNFISKQNFLDRINHGYYIEYSEFRGWYYGTPVDGIKLGAINIVIVNPQGLRNMIDFQQRFTIVPIYLQASAYCRLQRSIDREKKFKIEFLRRMVVDNINFIAIKKLLYKFKYRLVLSKDDITPYRQGLAIERYLKYKYIIKNHVRVGNSQ